MDIKSASPRRSKYASFLNHLFTKVMAAPTMPSTSKDEYGLGDPLMLEKIDKLFACGVGELIDLPQIVVVGDQSSGKSSVLEGLIKKPLPRDSGLCTRFATQIVFRRAATEQISVSIIPSRDASAEHASKLKAWGKSDLKSLSSDVFVQIMNEGDPADPKPTFSNNVLRLEISGPDQEHLSVVDVPGIFKSTTAGLTTKADIMLVRRMVLGYMRNPRSIMLAVVPANVDIATQEILELAADVDPKGDRTLGILTKPDLVDRGAEAGVIDLVEGRKQNMKLGWHIVRNPGQQHLFDLSLHRGNLEMDFFRSEAPWSNLEKYKVGVESLRIRLKEVAIEIRKRLADNQKLLKDLGAERSSSAAQAAFLTDVATNFQRLVTLALSANYGADDVFDSRSALRIAPATSARMEEFSRAIAHYGHTYSFLSSTEFSSGVGSSTPASHASAEHEDEHEDEIPEIAANTRKKHDVEDLVNILQPPQCMANANRTGIEGWLREIYHGNRGFELGTWNATILATTMKKQASGWRAISLGYVSDIIVLVHEFILAALHSVCPDTDVRNVLLGVLYDGLIVRYESAIKHTLFLLEVEGEGVPMTLNHYFNDNLQKSRSDKFVAALKKVSIDNCKHGEVVQLKHAINTQPMSNANHVIHDIHDILEAYYKVTRKTFVDNVCRQSTDHFLFSDAESPLKYFSPNFVSRLSLDELESIAGEAPKLKRARAQLAKEIQSLMEAKRILART
nr:interferon-induced gtp-binding protein mx1 [Quercus suber]